VPHGGTRIESRPRPGRLHLARYLLRREVRALEAAPDEESRTAVNYELASAYEAAGRKREALDHFMEVYGTNIDYRDVANRIRDLRSTV
jgi:thioredoxin-like negative regulator of GroEL